MSLRLNYPNAFDRQQGTRDGRTNLGGDIMIHGQASSIGCLAIGDSAVEELFILAAEANWSEAKVILAPVDLRKHEAPLGARVPWLPQLYRQIADALRNYPSTAADARDVRSR